MKEITLDGVVHEFPDDASDDEVRLALGQKTTGEQAEVRKSDDKIAQGTQLENSLKKKGVSYKERQMAFHVMLTPAEQLEEDKADLTPANFDKLEAEIARTKNPKAKKILVEEHNRLKGNLATILGLK